jgi:hypothetical protein
MTTIAANAAATGYAVQQAADAAKPKPANAITPAGNDSDVRAAAVARAQQSARSLDVVA